MLRKKAIMIFFATPGQRITLEKVGVYSVTNDEFTRELFFYDGDY